MGRDKAVIEYDGQPLLTHSVLALASAGASEVFVVGRQAREILGTPAIPDLFPGEGPLGGVISALTHSCEPIVAFMPCDLTNANPLSVTKSLAALGSADVAVPVVEGHRQWVHAVFRTTALDSLREQFSAGARSLRAGVSELRLVEVPGGEALWFRDADLPSDLL